MKKVNIVDAIIGLIIPWITLILLVVVPTYYCDLLWLRAICIFVAGMNGSVMLRLAWNTFRNLKK